MPDVEADLPGAARAFIGCAGWSLRKEQFPLFSSGSSHLERYSSRLDCVEINSSFYRSHRVTTYQRWRDVTPPSFRFSVKLPKQITHVNRLKHSHEAIAQFSAEVGGLGWKLGAILVQLPPSFEFERSVADEFFAQLKNALRSPVVVEPRHSSWFEEAATSLLTAWAVGRVAADPAITVEASTPLIAGDLAYYRWHGSPRIYYSSYSQSSLSELAHRVTCLITEGRAAWCIFDNTADGAATINAVAMQSYCDEASNDCECR